MKATVSYRVPPCWRCGAHFDTWGERDKHLRGEPCRPQATPARGPGAPLSHGDQRL